MGRVVVVVVGGSVVVVLRGGIVDVVPELGSTTAVGMVVGGTAVVEDVLVVEDEPWGTSGIDAVADPGCSRATTPPISAAPPVAAMATV